MLTPGDIEQFRQAFNLLDFQQRVRAENSLQLLVQASEVHARYIKDKPLLFETERVEVERQVRDIKLRYKETMFLCGEHPDDDTIRAYDSILKAIAAS